MVRTRSRHALVAAALAATLLATVGVSVASGARPLGVRALERDVQIAVRAALPDARRAVVKVVTTGRGWAFGTAAIPAPADDHVMPTTLMFVARLTSTGWHVTTERSIAFATELRFAPDTVVSPHARTLLRPAVADSHDRTRTRTATASSGGIGLPWGWGESRRLSGGPHHNGGSDAHPWSALDFAGGDGRVRAAADGVAYVPCRNLVRITHGDGWGTSYYHISGIAVSHGQTVRRGQYLGMQSTGTGCGGRATGPHQHFALMRNGSFVNLHGHVIGGWTVREGRSEYYGCLTRDGVSRCAGDGQPVYNGASALAASRAPNAPTPKSPADTYSTQDGRAPNLCWTNNGDADGDSVRFVAEVWQSGARQASVSTTATCWRPATLDGRNGDYSWRVKARDSTDKESAWSATRRFTIAGKFVPPDAPRNLSATAVSPSQIRFTWEDRSTTDDGFQILRWSTADGSKWVRVGTVTASAPDAFTDSTASAQTTYRYTACAYNGAGRTCDAYANAKSATTPARTTVTVDERTAGFTRAWWWGAKETGYGSHHYYTYAKTGTAASSGAWSARLAQGSYEVFAYVPQAANNSRSAPYTIYHAGGTTLRRVDQSAVSGWVSLGTYEFATGLVRRVRVTDATGEDSRLARVVRADAIRLDPRP